MDTLTKGALGATVILVLGAVGFGVTSMVKSQDRIATENEALKQQMAEDRKQRADDKAAELQRQIAEGKESTEAQLAAMRADMMAQMDERTRKMEEERRIVEMERAQLSETIAETVATGGIESDTDAELNAMQKKILAAASIGDVLEVNEELGFVVVGAGSSNGIQPDQRYNVRRSKFIVGEILISSVEDEKHSVGNIVAGSTQPGLSLRAGDQLISHPVY